VRVRSSGRQSASDTNPGHTSSQSPNQPRISSSARQRALPNPEVTIFSFSTVTACNSGASAPGMRKLEIAR